MEEKQADDMLATSEHPIMQGVKVTDGEKRQSALAVGRGKRLANLKDAKLVAQDLQQSLKQQEISQNNVEAQNVLTGAADQSGWNENNERQSGSTGAESKFKHSSNRADKHSDFKSVNKGFKNIGKHNTRPSFSQNQNYNKTLRGEKQFHRDQPSQDASSNDEFTSSWGGRKRELDRQPSCQNNTSETRFSANEARRFDKKFQVNSENKSEVRHSKQYNFAERPSSSAQDKSPFMQQNVSSDSKFSNRKYLTEDAETSRSVEPLFSDKNKKMFDDRLQQQLQASQNRKNQPMPDVSRPHKHDSAPFSNNRDKYHFGNAAVSGQQKDFSFNRNQQSSMPPRFLKANHQPFQNQHQNEQGFTNFRHYESDRNEDNFKRRKHVAENSLDELHLIDKEVHQRRVQNMGDSLIVKFDVSSKAASGESGFTENVVEQVELEGTSMKNKIENNERNHMAKNNKNDEWLQTKQFVPNFGEQNQNASSYGNRKFDRNRNFNKRSPGKGPVYKNQKHAGPPRNTNNVLVQGANNNHLSKPNLENWEASTDKIVTSLEKNEVSASVRNKTEVKVNLPVAPGEIPKHHDEDNDSEKSLKRFVEENTLHLDIQFDNLSLLDGNMTSPEVMLKTPVGHEKILDWAAAVENDLSNQS